MSSLGEGRDLVPPSLLEVLEGDLTEWGEAEREDSRVEGGVVFSLLLGLDLGLL